MVIKIKNFEDEGDKKFVGFEVKYNGSEFNIDKRIKLKSGTKDEEYIDAAWKLAEPEVNEWKSSIENVGKIWNPEDKKFN